MTSLSTLLGQKDSVPARCEWATHNNEQSFDVEIFMTTAATVSKAKIYRYVPEKTRNNLWN